jgi:hypothetical protein
MTEDDRKTKRPNPDEEVVLLEDLLPRSDVRGGSATTIFGQEPRGAPPASDGPARDKPEVG